MPGSFEVVRGDDQASGQVSNLLFVLYVASTSHARWVVHDLKTVNELTKIQRKLPKSVN